MSKYVQMLQYVIALFCFLWFIRVWVCLFGAPFRLFSRIVMLFFKAVKTGYAKIPDVAKYTRVQRQQTPKDTNNLKK